MYPELLKKGICFQALCIKTEHDIQSKKKTVLTSTKISSVVLVWKLNSVLTLAKSIQFSLNPEMEALDIFLPSLPISLNFSQQADKCKRLSNKLSFQ